MALRTLAVLLVAFIGPLASVGWLFAKRSANAVIPARFGGAYTALKYPLPCFPVRRSTSSNAEVTLERWNALKARIAPSQVIKSPSELLHHLINQWVFDKYPSRQYQTGRDYYYALCVAAHTDKIGWDGNKSPIFYRDSVGRLRIARLGEGGSEAHPDQILAGFAEIACPIFQPIGNQSVSSNVEELVHSSAWFLQSQQELCWTLEALARYHPSAEAWQSWDGRTWSVEALLRQVCSEQLGSGSCFGTHALRATAVALRANEQRRFLDAATVNAARRILLTAIDRLRMSQHDDGNWGRGWERLSHVPWNRPDSIRERLHVTGHTLEWMLLAPADISIDETLIHRAALFCWRQLQSASKEEMAKEICTYSHAYRAIRHWYRTDLEALGEPSFVFEGPFDGD